MRMKIEFKATNQAARISVSLAVALAAAMSCAAVLCGGTVPLEPDARRWQDARAA